MNVSSSSTSRVRWLILAGLLLVSGLIALISRLRKSTNSAQALPEDDQPESINYPFPDQSNAALEIAPEKTVPVLDAVLQPEKQDAVVVLQPSAAHHPPASLGRIFAFIVLTGVAAVGLVALQNQSSLISAPIFMLLLFGSLTFAAWSAPEARDQLGRDVLRRLREARLVFLDFRSGKRYMVGLASMCAGFALLLMTYATFQLYRAYLQEAPPYNAVGWLLLGIGLMGAAMLFNRPLVPAFAFPLSVGARVPARTRHWITYLGILILLIVTEINTNLFGFGLEVHYVVQIALLLSGFLLLMIGLGGQSWRLPQLTKYEALLLCVITVVAFIPRVVGLESIVHRFVDEIHFAGAVARLDSVPNTQILTPFAEVTAFAWAFPLMQAGSVGVFGPTLFALRLPSAIVGTLTVPALYFLARTLFDRRTAIIAALLLATFPPHIHFSRLALNNIADPLFGTLALGFLFRGLKWGRRSDYVVAGVMLGLTQYFYEGGRLLYPPLMVTAFVVSWWTLKRGRAHWHHAAIGLLAAILVAAPVALTLIDTTQTLLPRMREAGISEREWDMTVNNLIEPDQTFKRFGYPFLLYVEMPDLGWFYGGYQPLVMRHFVPIFLIGFGVLLWRWRVLGMLPILIWVVATSMGNALFIRDYAWTARYVVAFPALVLMMALGLRHFLPLLWPPQYRPQIRHLAVAALLVALAVGQVVYYFGDHMPTFNRQFRTNTDVDDALFRAQELEPETHVYLIVPYAVWLYNLIIWHDFFNMDVLLESRYPVEIDEKFLNSLSDSNHYAFFIEQDDMETLKKLQSRFELTQPTYSPYDIPTDKQLVLYLTTPYQQR